MLTPYVQTCFTGKETLPLHCNFHREVISSSMFEHLAITKIGHIAVFNVNKSHSVLQHEIFCISHVQKSLWHRAYVCQDLFLLLRHQLILEENFHREA